VRAEDVDTRATRLSCPAISIPREAKEAKVNGTIVAKCMVTETGAVTSCRIIKGQPFMDQAAIAAFSGCKYKPAMAKGQPVSTEVVISAKVAAD
jgi:TonB family protein